MLTSPETASQTRGELYRVSQFARLINRNIVAAEKKRSKVENFGIEDNLAFNRVSNK